MKQKLLNMKRHLDSLVKKESELLGQKKQVLTDLEEFGIKNLKGADKELAKLEKQSEQLNGKLEGIVEELEENYDWD